MRPDASITRRRSVTVYCSFVSNDFVVERWNAAFQNDGGTLARLMLPNVPSNGAVPDPVAAVMNAAFAGSAPGAKSSFHV